MASGEDSQLKLEECSLTQVNQFVTRAWSRVTDICYEMYSTTTTTTTLYIYIYIFNMIPSQKINGSRNARQTAKEAKHKSENKTIPVG